MEPKLPDEVQTASVTPVLITLQYSAWKGLGIEFLTAC